MVGANALCVFHVDEWVLRTFTLETMHSWHIILRQSPLLEWKINLSPDFTPLQGVWSRRLPAFLITWISYPGYQEHRKSKVWPFATWCRKRSHFWRGGCHLPIRSVYLYMCVLRLRQAFCVQIKAGLHNPIHVGWHLHQYFLQPQWWHPRASSTPFPRQWPACGIVLSPSEFYLEEIRRTQFPENTEEMRCRSSRPWQPLSVCWELAQSLLPLLPTIRFHFSRTQITPPCPALVKEALQNLTLAVVLLSFQPADGSRWCF